MQAGNGCFHSPDGKQNVSDTPRNPKPLWHENEARPPTSRDRIETLGTDRFEETAIGISPHSMPLKNDKILFICSSMQINAYIINSEHTFTNW